MLAVTDANVLLGRVIPEFFPHIFGPHEDQPLDREAVLAEFERLTQEASRSKHIEGRREMKRMNGRRFFPSSSSCL